jgi:surface protein
MLKKQLQILLLTFLVHTGIYGQSYALDFDGTNDYATTPIDADLQAMPSTTWSGWIKPTSVSGYQIIFGMEDGGWDRMLLIEPGGGLSLGHTDNRWQTGISIATGAWQHVAVVYDNGAMRFYFNGTAYATTTTEGNHSSAGTFTIGGNQSPGGNYYRGLIDEVAVWNEALTAAEITTLYNSGIGLDAASNSGNYASASNLVGYYKMNEGTGTTLVDASGNVNTATLSNMDAADWVTGVSMVAVINPFVTTWQTDASTNVIIPLTGGGYDFSIDWGDGTIQTITGTPGNISRTYTTAGIKTVSITPNITTGFPRIYVNNFANRLFLRTIESWGSGQWGSAVNSFFGAANLEINATDTPNFSQTTNFTQMFLNCTSLTGSNGFSNWTLNTNAGASISFANMFYRATLFNGPISNWDVSRVTNMNGMFTVTNSFNQDLSNWDVSSVTNMSLMFHASRFNAPLNWGIKTANVTDISQMFHTNSFFNQDINGWDVSSVTNMRLMFYRAGFNGDLNNWNVSSLTDATSMFQESAFNGAVSNWQFTTDPTKNINMGSMFQQSTAFNQNISGWDVTRVNNMFNMFLGATAFNAPLNWGIKTSNVTNMAGMFTNASVFNQDISTWNVANVTNMSNMFWNADAFNINISSWNVSNVTNMSGMFGQTALFNQDISTWNVANVTNMSNMFINSPFNSPLNWGIKTGNVTNMSSMFQNTALFNQDLNSWDVSKVTNFQQMFYDAILFNGNISSWSFTTDVTKNISMASMFRDARAFNQDISNWNVSRVNQMQRMFQGAPLNQDMSAWDISNVTNLQLFIGKLSRVNYNALLVGWSTLDAGETRVPINLAADFGSSKYSNTSAILDARNTQLISNKSWTITDGGVDSDITLPLIASNSLALNNTTISITFSEAVFKTDLGSGTLEISDFLFALSGGTATLSATTPISITSTNNLTFVLGIGLTGTPNGNEILTVTPVLNAIFDASGNAAATIQTNNIANLNDLSPPVITGPDSTTGSSSSISISENHTSGFSFTANKPVTWTLGNSNDETLFAIDSSGSLTFINAPDYEAPLSSTSSNIYLVEVIATDGSSRVSRQTLTITILDVPPTIFGTFNAINKYYFSGTHTIIAPSTNNSNPITYTSDNTTVATITGTTITFTGVGTANIIATQASDANYESSSVSALLTVVSENVVSKYGGISPTNPNYVDRHGKIGGATGLSNNGQIVQVKTLIPGLVLYLDASNVNSYPGSGTTWTDISGNENNGTLNNGVVYNNADGGSLVFDGVNDFFRTTSNLNLTDTDKITIQIILKSASLSGSMVLEHSTNWNAHNSFGVLVNDPSRKMNFTDFVPGSGYNTKRSVSNVIDGNWHFITVTADRSKGSSDQNLVYVDGVLSTSGNIGGQTSDNNGNYGSLPLFIGSRAGSGFFFSANIAQVLIYKRVLTPLEIQTNFNALKARYGL